MCIVNAELFENVHSLEDKHTHQTKYFFTSNPFATQIVLIFSSE